MALPQDWALHGPSQEWYENRLSEQIAERSPPLRELKNHCPLMSLCSLLSIKFPCIRYTTSHQILCESLDDPLRCTALKCSLWLSSALLPTNPQRSWFRHCMEMLRYSSDEFSSQGAVMVPWSNTLSCEWTWEWQQVGERSFPRARLHGQCAFTGCKGSWAFAAAVHEDDLHCHYSMLSTKIVTWSAMSALQWQCRRKNKLCIQGFW